MGNQKLAVVVILVLYFVFWILPHVWHDTTLTAIPYIPRGYQHYHQLSCLFTKSVTHWESYYFQVKLEGEISRWQFVLEKDLSRMKPFGHRSRLHRIIRMSRAKVHRNDILADICDFIKNKCNEPNRVVAARIILLKHEVSEELAGQIGAWKKPSTSELLEGNWKMYVIHTATY